MSLVQALGKLTWETANKTKMVQEGWGAFSAFCVGRSPLLKGQVPQTSSLTQGKEQGAKAKILRNVSL